jgi:hypothetical protein
MNQTIGGHGVTLRRATWLWLAASLCAGCDESGPRVYTAQPYRALLDCLDPYAPLSLVEARDVSSVCEAVCLRVGVSLYVSTVCAPYPGEAALVGLDDTECAAALAAPSCSGLTADAGGP